MAGSYICKVVNIIIQISESFHRSRFKHYRGSLTNINAQLVNSIPGYRKYKGSPPCAIGRVFQPESYMIRQIWLAMLDEGAIFIADFFSLTLGVFQPLPIKCLFPIMFYVIRTVILKLLFWESTPNRVFFRIFP